MSAATIVFCDIVGFSKKSSDLQKDIIQSLNSEVTHELFKYIRSLFESPRIIAIPTGDGMAIALLHDSHNWNYQLFSLIRRLMLWSKDQSLALRVGIHTGAVHLLSDINGRPNISGSTINLCQRVMDAANPNQVLFSEVAYQEYVGTEFDKLTHPPFSIETPAFFQGPYSIIVKHDLQINVYVMHMGKPGKNWWDNNFPISKDEIKVSLTQLPKQIDGPFSKNISNATRIALIQLTGENLLPKLQKEEITLCQNLEKFWVFMPQPKSYSDNTVFPLPLTEFLEKKVKEWNEYLRELNSKYPNSDIKLKLFKEPSYFGGSFLDWDRKGGKIHVSPYIWGIAADLCPGYDMAWISDVPSPVYDTYCKGLEKLNDLSEDCLNKE